MQQKLGPYSSDSQVFLSKIPTGRSVSWLPDNDLQKNKNKNKIYSLSSIDQ